MDGERSAEMDDAWLAYLDERSRSGSMRGWNPRRVFEAGWWAAVNAGVVRSSGWSSNE